MKTTQKHINATRRHLRVMRKSPYTLEDWSRRATSARRLSGRYESEAVFAASRADQIRAARKEMLK